jgi:hypothetical protein
MTALPETLNIATQVRRFLLEILNPNPGHCESHQVTLSVAGGFFRSTAAWVSLIVGTSDILSLAYV